MSLVCLATACSHDVKSLPPPPTTISPPEPAQLQDFSGTQWILASGKATTTTQSVKGTSTINGQVTSNGSPVPGATVVLEHFFGDGSSTSKSTFTANEMGNYSITNVVGGRYRVHAFQPPTLGTATAQVFFLKNGDTKTVNFTLNVYSGTTLNWAIAPNPPIVQQSSALGVVLTQKTVKADGTISSVAIPGAQITLANGSGITLQSPATLTTGSSGTAQWIVKCTVVSKPTVTFTISGAAPQVIQLPGCVNQTTTTVGSTTTSR